MPARYPYRKILIPVDFSEVSIRSLEHGLEIARATGASVVLLTVVDTSFPYPDLFSFEDPKSDYFRVMRERALERMGEWLGELPEAKAVKVERVVTRGRPAVEIPAIAEEVGAELMIVARHGSSGLRHAFMGNTTESVVRSSPCPVLVLPPEAGDEGDE
jgi:nucleotide-binding universal stress UspA family protein